MTDTDNLKAFPDIPKPPPQHIFGDDVAMAGEEFPDNNPRTLRSCALCGLIKVTVHGNGWVKREWRLKDGKVWPFAPECEPST